MKIKVFLTGFAMLLGLDGCAGGNGGTPDNPSPFLGTYSGTISSTSGTAQTIDANWTANAAGYINGSDSNGGAAGIDSGFVDLNGVLKVTSKAQGYPSILFNAYVVLSGPSGDMSGDGTETVNGQQQGIHISLLRQ